MSALVALLIAGAGIAWWLPSNAALADRVARSASSALGVPVTVGGLTWRLLPAPRVVLRDVATGQPEPLQLRRLELQPRLWPLLAGRIELARVVLDGGRIAQRSLGALGEGPPPSGRPSRAGTLALGQVVFRDLTWVSRHGVALVFAGEADFGPGLQLRQATVRRPGATPAADITVTRADGQADGTRQQRFDLQVRLGGGTAAGQATLETDAQGGLRLHGALSPRDVEVQGALASLGRPSPLRGQASGETTLDAQGRHAGSLAQQLHTRTRFTMAPATLLDFDLDRAVRTLGREHQGQTAIERLSGEVDTQNMADGMVMRFTGLKAHAGAFSATGEGRLADRQLHATATIDVVDGVVGAPLRIDGPLGHLDVTVSKAPVVGAAIGTAVLPGVGTALGASIGRVLGEAPTPTKSPSRP